MGNPGCITVVDTAALSLIETVITEPGAHTLGWDSGGETLYVFCPGSGGVALYADGEDGGG